GCGIRATLATPAAQLVAQVRTAGGAAVLAHPLRYGQGMTDNPSQLAEIWRLFDAVEVWTPSHRPEENCRAFELARRFGLAATAGSDAHTTEPLGRWATRFEEPLRDNPDLIAALRAGRCSPWRQDVAK
ncbi:MAG: hypothetical protein JRJ59_05935, partial [Deltaproteobacteria bacterium]|nr:hypothetical protein [Deltaproteobacteria bacterium]